MAKKRKDVNTGEVYWICDCGSGFRAVYNLESKLNCRDEERVCILCWKKRPQKQGGEDEKRILQR